jgi:hypothetical protein
VARFPYLSVRSAAKIRLAVAPPPTRSMRHVRAGIFPEDWKSRLQASSERARNLVGGLAAEIGKRRFWPLTRPTQPRRRARDQARFDQRAPKDFLWQISHIK